jgi:hypothetical protein
VGRRRARHLDPELEVGEPLSWDPVRASDKGEQPPLAFNVEAGDNLPEGAAWGDSARQSRETNGRSESVHDGAPDKRLVLAAAVVPGHHPQLGDVERFGRATDTELNLLGAED